MVISPLKSQVAFLAGTIKTAESYTSLHFIEFLLSEGTGGNRVFSSSYKRYSRI